jgi:uncharacterized protein (TIGR00297 family)
VAPDNLAWQSKLVLLLVLPVVAADVTLQIQASWAQAQPVTLWTLGLSSLLGLIAWKTRSATPLAAATGAAITASLIFSTASRPYQPWKTGLVPVLTVLILTSLATRLGRRRKEQLGTAESRKGRRASQVAANLGAAALACVGPSQTWQINQPLLHLSGLPYAAIFIAGLAALCEAAADTVSSELGQVLNSRPRMITTLRVAEPGTDGAISIGGTAAGLLAAAFVALAGSAALGGGWLMLLISWAGGAFGLFFDSFLGATFERRGWLNNDGVNFLSTCSAAICAWMLLAFRARLGLH